MNKKTDRNYTIEKKTDVTKNREKDGTGGDTSISRGMTLEKQKVGGVGRGLKVEKKETNMKKKTERKMGKSETEL